VLSNYYNWIGGSKLFQAGARILFIADCEHPTPWELEDAALADQRGRRPRHIGRLGGATHAVALGALGPARPDNLLPFCPGSFADRSARAPCGVSPRAGCPSYQGGEPCACCASCCWDSVVFLRINRVDKFGYRRSTHPGSWCPVSGLMDRRKAFAVRHAIR